jgi:hypothetical protein
MVWINCLILLIMRGDEILMRNSQISNALSEQCARVNAEAEFGWNRGVWKSVCVFPQFHKIGQMRFYHTNFLFSLHIF